MKVNYTKKQTSVEFFSDKVCEIIGWIPQTVDQAKALLEALEQAKAMEKEQIIESYKTGARYALISQSDLALIKGKFPTPEQYYNETFKSE